MNFKEFAVSEQGKAAQIVLAGALNYAGVDLNDESIVEVEAWIKDANDLAPDPMDIAGAGITLAKAVSADTKATWDDVVVSKINQIWDIFNEGSSSVLDKFKALGVVFQRKRKSLNK